VAPECEDENLFPDEVYDIEDHKEKLARCAAERKKRGCWDTEACGAQGIFNDADVLADIEAMEKWMRAQKFVGYTGSYAQYVRLVNMLLMAEPGTKPSKADLAIPTREYLLKKDPNDDRDPDEIVQLYNGLLEMMTSAGDMDSFISKDWNEGVVLGFINTMDPRETHQITMDIQSYIEAHKNDKGFRKVKFGLRCGPADAPKVVAECDEKLGQPGPNYVRPGLGGFLGATEATREVAMANWLTGPLQTAAAVFIIVALIFRSFVVAGLLIITLFITLFAQYGLGGYFTSIEEWSGNLAFHLLVTLSIAMGLGVDYGIYILSRLREEMQATGGNWEKSLRNTLNTTGSAVIISIVVLLGSFIPLLNTNLANTWGLAIYIGEALIIDVFTALMLLPVMVRWFKPAYVFKANNG
jgi:predicted RND superfamily exporter protein